MEPSTTVTFFSDPHRASQGSPQPLHSRHEDGRSVMGAVSDHHVSVQLPVSGIRPVIYDKIIKRKFQYKII